MSRSLGEVVSEATEVAWRLRTPDADEARRDLARMDRQQLEEVAAALALMVDIDKPVSELLAATGAFVDQPWTEDAIHVRQCNSCQLLFMSVRPNRVYCTQVCRRRARQRTWRQYRARVASRAAS
jgi:hypothetical protein